MFLISRASLKKHNLLWLHRRGLPAAFLFTLTSIYALVAEEPERLGCCSLLRHLRGSYILPLNIRMQSFLTIDLMYCSGVSILHSCGCNYICLSVVGLLHEGYERPDHALQCPMSAISADCSRHGMKHLFPPLGHSVLSRISRAPMRKYHHPAVYWPSPSALGRNMIPKLPSPFLSDRTS